MSAQATGVNAVARFAKFVGPYVTSKVYRLSFSSSAARPKCDEVEDHFDQLVEKGVGVVVKFKKMIVLYKTSPQEIRPDLLVEMGVSVDEYVENYQKAPGDSPSKAEFTKVIRESPFFEDIKDMFAGMIDDTVSPPGAKKAKGGD